MSATRKIKGPSGVIVECPKHVASGLVGGGHAQYADADAPDAPDGAPNTSWTVVQLKAHADEHDIDLGEATKKADILAAIEAAASDSGQD